VKDKTLKGWESQHHVSSRILLKNQTKPSENGTYTYQGSGSPLGSSGDTLVPQAVVRVAQGTVNGKTEWSQSRAIGPDLGECRVRDEDILLPCADDSKEPLGLEGKTGKLVFSKPLD
jgi:hypothetical protein